MAQITQNKADKTILIFDSFYNYKLVVNASEFDIVYSYFKGISNNTKIAGNFTAFLFRIAQQSGYSAVSLLEQIKGKTKLQQTAIITYYLNTFKSKESLYGVGIIPNPNQAIQRNVLL
jgi:hypothetical protein